MKPKVKNVNFKMYKKALKRLEFIRPIDINAEHHFGMTRQSGKVFSISYIKAHKKWIESLIKNYRLNKIKKYKERKILKCKI